jgi:hypothetical protein
MEKNINEVILRAPILRISITECEDGKFRYVDEEDDVDVTYDAQDIVDYFFSEI